jgi:tRNA pseudouridine synthase 10
MNSKLLDKKFIEIAKKITKEYSLCDSCLGRFFYKVEKVDSNKIRGRILREKIKINEVPEESCWLCEGLISEVNLFVKLIKNVLKDYEFDTFLIGSKIDEDIIKRENEIMEFLDFEIYESIKNEINREIGKILEKDIDKEVNFEKPTIMVILDTSFNQINLQIQSLYVYGRYKKYSRKVPQTKWYCKYCKGKGCRKCNYSGKLYQDSVEETVSKEFLKETKASDERFHGAGREDIDVLMLGSGRPFVLELLNPKIRSIALDKISENINTKNKELIEISNLRFCEKNEVSRIKAAKFKKVYRVKFECEKAINNEKLIKATHSLRGTVISQFTPSRVAHRRAEMVREKHIYDCQLESLEDTMAIITLETESGTYIKEIVSGDQGRTKPNLSEMLGYPCKVKELDVIKIRGE